MSHDLIQKVTYVFPQTDDFSATGENFSEPFANPIDIYRFGYIAETAVVVDATAAASLEAEVAGGGTNRVSGSVLSLVDADDHAIGRVIYTDVVIPVAESTLNTVGIGGQKRNVDPSGPFHVRPGERVSINITDAGTSGTIRWFIEYANLAFAQPSTVAASDGVTVTKK